MIKGLGKDVFIYLIGNLAQRAVSFFLLPLYTRSLTMTEYGLVEQIMITIQVLIFLMDIGMSRSVLRYYARYKEDPSKSQTMFTTALMIMITSMVSWLVIGLVLREPLAGMIFGDPIYGDILAWTLVVSTFSTLLQWIYILFRAQLKSARYVRVSIVNLIALTGLNILFVRFLNMGVYGVLLAEGLVTLLLSVVFLPGILRLSRGKITLSRQMAKQLFTFGFPLIFTSAGMMVINSLDRYFLVNYRGLEDVGIYSLAARIAAMLTMLVVTPFQLAWAPYLFQKEKDDISQMAARTFTYLVLVLSIVSSLFLLFSRESILVLASPQFMEARIIMPYLFISVIMVAIYYWAGGLVNLAEQTWKLGVIVFLAGISNILLNIFLTPEFGQIGAAWSNVLARAFAAIITMFVAIQYKAIRFEYKRLVLILVLTVGLWAVYFLVFDDMTGIIAFGLKAALGLVALVIVIALFPTSHERQQFSQVASSLWSRMIRLRNENS